LDTGLDASERNLDSFLHETCLLAEFSCHFGKSYLPHMTSFMAEILCVYRNVSHEAKKIEFASIGLLMAKGQHWQIARFDFESCDFHALPYFIFSP